MPTTVVLSIWLSLTGVYSAGVNDGTAASPALVVQGLGHMSVPITPEQSSQLKALCSPDPGHLKDATDDPDKCPAWQLAPSQFECSNPNVWSYSGLTSFAVCIYMLLLTMLKAQGGEALWSSCCCMAPNSPLCLHVL